MNPEKTFKELCTPAMLYFVISIVAIMIALLSGMKLALVLTKTIFVVFWTFLLNLLCKNGFKSISWFLVLLPYVFILAIFLLAFFKIKEGFEDAMPGSSDDPDKKKAAAAAAAQVVADSVTETK